MSRWLIAYNTRPALPTLNREAQPPQPTANDAERRCLPIGSINNIPGSFHNAIDISGDICPVHSQTVQRVTKTLCCKQACMLYLVEHGGQKVERNAHLRSFTGHSKGQKSACVMYVLMAFETASGINHKVSSCGQRSATPKLRSPSNLRSIVVVLSLVPN